MKEITHTRRYSRIVRTRRDYGLVLVKSRCLKQQFVSQFFGNVYCHTRIVKRPSISQVQSPKGPVSNIDTRTTEELSIMEKSESDHRVKPSI